MQIIYFLIMSVNKQIQLPFEALWMPCNSTTAVSCSDSLAWVKRRQNEYWRL